ALVVVGLSDFAMLLGIALLVVQNGLRVELAPRFPFSLTEPMAIGAFLLIVAGALAKAGSMPLHTWIPAASKTAPPTVMAFIPASLDKLLGIYLLVRLTVYVFDISTSPAMGNVLMAVGALTILAAVMMALVQKRAMRLLSFHAISQVGYMVLGIGTGTAVGIAGGLFHMVNNVIYKTGLFLAAGSVEHWTKDDELDKLGGLAGQMPITFISFAVCALAIAGVPPLNGFVSKWMVYQGVIANGAAGNRLFPIFLVAAMLGSVLTLASFLKLMHAMFLGQRPETLARVREVPITMWLPPALTALACVVFGVFAFPVPLNGLILPGLPFFEIPLAGIWQPIPATLLGLVALGLGALVYLLGTVAKPVAGRTFVGGEKIADNEESRVTGPAFYTPVKKLPIVGELLDFGERGAFDLYNWVTGLTHGVGEVARHGIDRTLNALTWLVAEVVRLSGLALSRLQTGSLPLYVAWVFAGAAVFYLVLFLRCG
ncbi:MAG: proton-conducting transporter membrane subunit, partial [candidate division WOR-3 bacterium]